jgi:hypothetical protein
MDQAVLQRESLGHYLFYHLVKQIIDFEFSGSLAFQKLKRAPWP